MRIEERIATAKATTARQTMRIQRGEKREEGEATHDESDKLTDN